MENKNDKINKSIETAFKSLRELVDVNTVIGKPLSMVDGEYVIPVSKVTIGTIIGGGEYGKVKVFSSNNDFPFSAGNGAVISIKPCCFLVRENGDYKILSVSENSYEKLADKVIDIISNIKE